MALALAALVLLTALALLARRPPHHAGRPDCTPAPATARAAFYNDAALSRQFNRTIMTASPSAQTAFNRGWLLLCGFHSDAAVAAFRAAAAADPAAALTHCGIALALGPGANRAALDVDLAEGEASPFPAFRPADAPAATAAAAECARLAATALAANPTSPIAVRDAAWAAAVVARFAPGTERGERRLAADLAFADEMDSISLTHADPDASALAADARIATRAWDYRDGVTGRMLPHAAGAAASARAALARAPRHPLALHILIHLHETGTPARCGESGGGITPADLCASEGEGVAGALAEAGPWTTARVGHLLHMPGHLFSRIGFYADAVRAGLAAIAADEAVGAACVEAYAVEHNAVSLASAAAANGDANAEAAALRALERLPFHGGPAMLYAGGTVDVATATFHRIMAADWRALETAPRPGPLDRTPCLAGGREAATVAWALGRALAACARAQRAAVRGNATGQARDAAARARAAAGAAVDAVATAAAAVPPDPITLPGPSPGLYACEHEAVAAAAVAAATARLALLDGDPASAATILGPAVTAADVDGPYYEPPRHMWPLAPCLGWALLAARDADGAERAFRGDLAVRPSNPRGLLGLSLARAALGDAAGAADAAAASARRWRGSKALVSPCAAFSEF